MAAGNEIEIDAPPGEPVMHLTRRFDAPRDLVWETFTKAEHIARWWGPRKYAITVHEFDVRPGGKWRISHSDGTKTVEFFGEYREVVKAVTSGAHLLLRRLSAYRGGIRFP